jgi:hypothetical protein
MKGGGENAVALKLIIEFDARDVGLLKGWQLVHRAVMDLQRGQEPVAVADVAAHLGWTAKEVHWKVQIAKRYGVVEHCGGPNKFRGGWRALPIPELACSKPFERRRRRDMLTAAKIG